MNIALRPFEIDSDLPRVIEIMSSFHNEPLTQEAWQSEYEQEKAGDNVIETTVAVNDGGLLVGYSHIRRQYGTWDPGRLQVWIIAAPEVRRYGIGGRIYDAQQARLSKLKATKLDTMVRDDDPDSLRFAEARGFRLDRHMYSSRIDVKAADEGPFAGSIAEAEATGIHFFSLADLPDTEETRRKLYDLNKSIDADIPGERAFPSFEELSHIVFDSEWYRPDGQIIAADGDRWVGMTAVGHFPAEDAMHVMITGVDKEYRGRKIGVALKVLSHRCAKRYGARYVVTGNDTHNAPMLAINERLGYKRMRGTFYLQKVL